ncbi:Sec-independent protein translocase protein TatB [Desulfovibrio mangrovi]|uniref:Sec-independent protein translocase protein TatB n=1 Tax=Desulfovibrio mangrovi TaxID=2976983 RepID=UPI00224865B1|nr:Sec-independent protein translocase protein TatB [Desulfovibrio mangrovi]UZP67918.1 Sec-independent protein translocase protein TatB [Desulfovibrio mangrovi]
MFGIGTTEILVILVVALIILGPKSLPKIARTLGKGMAEFRRVSTDFQRTINTEIELEEHEKRKKAAAKRLYGDDDDTEEEEKPKKKAKAKSSTKTAAKSGEKTKAAKTAAKAAPKPAGDLAVPPDEVADAAASATEEVAVVGEKA